MHDTEPVADQVPFSVIHHPAIFLCSAADSVLPVLVTPALVFMPWPLPAPRFFVVESVLSSQIT